MQKTCILCHVIHFWLFVVIKMPQGLYCPKSIWQKRVVCSVISRNLMVGVLSFYSVRLLAAKGYVVLCLLWNCNENEVIIMKHLVLTVGMALRSLKAAGFFIQVETINILWHKMSCWDPNINFRKQIKWSDWRHPWISQTWIAAGRKSHMLFW